jgi:hypothetical protein
MGSSSKGATTSTSAPPPEVMAQYENVIAQANQVAQTPYTPYGGQLVQGFNPTQQTAFQTVDNAQGIAQPYFNAAANYATLGAAPITAAQIANYYNPYQQAVVGATLGNIQLLNAQQQAQLEGSTEGSGGLFNDRLGVAQAQLAGQQAAQEAPTIANIEQQGYTQALGAAQAQQGVYGQAAYTLGNLGTSNLQAILSGAQAQLGTGGLQQELGQTELSTLYNQWQQAQAYPFQDVSWLSSISTGLGSNMGGTSTTTPPLANQIAPWAGLGLAGLSLLKRGGGIDRPRLHYDFGGPVPATPWGNVASPYIPGGLQITHGSGPPKPPGTSTSTSPLDKVAQDAIKLAGAWNAKQNAAPTIGDSASADIAIGGQAAGVPGLDLGSAFERGGGIDRRNGYDAGGAPEVPSSRFDESGFDRGGDPPVYPGFGPAASLPTPAAVAPAPTGINAPVSPENAPWGGLTVPALSDTTAFRQPSWMAPGGEGSVTSGLGLGDVSGFTPSRRWPASADAAIGAAPADKTPTYPGLAGTVAKQWREAGASENAIRGVLYNVEAESSFNPNERHFDQPRFRGTEAENSHGLYQHGGSQWWGLDRYARGQNADWHDPNVQTAYEIENLQKTNPDVWRRMNEAGSWQEAAKIYARWLAPKQQYLEQRFSDIDKAKDPLSGRDIPSSARVIDTRTGRNLGDARVVDSSGETLPPTEASRHLFSPEVRSALLKAGFALMANRSPFLAQAIGDAGLVGVASFQEAKRYEGAQAMQERKMALSEKQVDLGVRRLDQAMRAADERLNLATKREANTELWRQAQMDRMTRAAEAGKIPPGYRMAPNGKDMEFIPGGPADPKVLSSTAIAKKPAVAGMSPELQEVNARQIVAGNLSPLVGLPRTPEGLQIRNALRQQAVGILMNERGMSVEQAANALNEAEQGWKSRQIGLNAEARTASTREANLNLILKATAGAVPAALEASEKVGRTRIVPLNRLIQKGEIMASDPDLVAFGMANLQLAEHWARAMNPTGVMRETDRDMALHFLDTGLSRGTYRTAVLQLQKQITRERDAIRGLPANTPVDVNAPTPAPGAGVKPEDVGGAKERPKLSTKDEQALTWANSHPDDPRAAQIKEHLGVSP